MYLTFTKFSMKSLCKENNKLEPLTMLAKLKALTKYKNESKAVIDLPSIKDELYEGLFNVMNESFEQRKSDTTNSKFTQKDVNKIIEAYARKNMIIAAAASIVPGPFGVLSALPELLLNFKNQMSMIYDLGCANGKENFINKDILLDIPISVFGGNTNLSKIQNNKTKLIDSPESVLLEKSLALCESLIERTLKKSIVQFIPIAGPVLMGTWAKLTTSKISKESLNFLNQQKEFVEHFKPSENEEIKRLLQVEKIKGLANLIESNSEINEKQIELIGTIIVNSDLNEEEKKYFLEESLKTGSKFKLDKDLLKKYEEDEDLLMQLIVMANRTGRIDELEKRCIYEIGLELEVDAKLIDELF